MPPSPSLVTRALSSLFLAVSVLPAVVCAQRPAAASDGGPPGMIARWAGATADVGVSNLVSRWRDLSGNGLDLFQEEGHFKPWRDYFAADGAAALDCDGNDFVWRADCIPLGSITRVVAFRVDELNLGGVLVGALPGESLRFLPGDAHLVQEQGGSSIVASFPVTLGEWNVAVSSYDDASGVCALYLNGALAAAGMLPPPADDDVSIGATKLGGFALRGAIAEVMLLDHAVTPAELAQLYVYFSPYLDKSFPKTELVEVPRDGQILPRDGQNRADVRFAGRVITEGFDSVRLQVMRNGLAYATTTQPLVYTHEGAPFTLVASIEAGLFDYEARLSLVAGSTSVLVARRDHLASGDAFLINGQSNSVAKDWHAEGLGSLSESVWIRSFGYGRYVHGFGPPPIVFKGDHNEDMHWDFADALEPHGHATVGQWGVRLAEHIVQTEGIPVAIINGGVEASKIQTHQRNDAYPLDPSGIYGRLLMRVLESGIQTRIRALFYYQGESDGLTPLLWQDGFDNLHEDWLVDYPTLEQIYVFQIREGCNVWNDGVREVQRTLGDVYPDVTVMSTTAVPSHDICHYYYVGYREIGDRIARLVQRDLYGIPSSNVEPPQILQAQWVSGQHDALLLTFGPPGDTLHVDPGSQAYFSVSDGTPVTSVTVVQPNQILLQLAAPSLATTVSWNGHQYDGPWVSNANGVGALSFFYFPIQ